MQGIVIKSTGSWYLVKAENGEIYRSRILGKFRLNGKKLTNPVAVGDKVRLKLETGDEKTALILEIQPRENAVIRQSPRKQHYLHLLAANIDQAIVLNTIVQPNLKQSFIDRFLLMTEPYDIPVVIVFNKCDLWEEEDWATFAYLEDIYSQIGYTTLPLSATEKKGFKNLSQTLKGKTTLIGGHSGVGKSTLINTLQPDLELATFEISDYSGKGQHTTTFAEMHELDLGGSIIDTPGIKSLSFIHLDPENIAANFKEIFKHSKHCRFSNCTHINEPNCAVKQAVEEGVISDLRYSNYVTIWEEIGNQNHWERKKGL